MKPFGRLIAWLRETARPRRSTIKSYGRAYGREAPNLISDASQQNPLIQVVAEDL
jgi:hypothetical protein